MQTLTTLRDQLPDFAKDVKINLSNVLTEEGSTGLNGHQIAGIALASAYATRNDATVKAVTTFASEILTPEEIQAAKSAAAIMAMNNVYYRFLHLAGDAELKTLPAKLRMTVIGNPGIPKVDFELYALAVSAINGCGMCIESHVHQVVKGGISKEGAQSAARIAAVIQAFAQSLYIMDQVV